MMLKKGVVLMSKPPSDSKQDKSDHDKDNNSLSEIGMQRHSSSQEELL